MTGPERGSRLEMGPPVLADCHLAVGHFPQSARMLPCHPAECASVLGNVVKGPNLRIPEQFDHLVGQTPLDLFHLPGTLAHELSQGLYVRGGKASRLRRDRLALPVQPQALNTNLSPVASLATAHGLQQLFEDTPQTTVEAYQALRCHGGTVANTAERIKNYLAQDY